MLQYNVALFVPPKYRSECLWRTTTTTSVKSGLDGTYRAPTEVEMRADEDHRELVKFVKEARYTGTEYSMYRTGWLALTLERDRKTP